MYTAELWAILQAISAPSLIDPIVFTDCLATVLSHASGFAATCAPRNIHAGVWSDLRATLGERTLHLAWIPAHTTTDAIDQVERSDGQMMSSIDREGNQIADELAKAAARAAALPAPELAAARRDLADATQLARALGAITAAAASFLLPDGTRIRDARPRDRRRQQAAVPHELPLPAPRPQQLGGHTLLLRDGRASCTVCKRSSGRVVRFAAQRCPGSAALRWARLAATQARHGRQLGPGHRRAISGTVVWCTLCGAYAEHVMRKMADPCQGRTHGTARARLEALQAGKHPKTGAALPPAIFELQWPDAHVAEPPPPPPPVPTPPASPAPSAAATRLQALAACVRARADRQAP